MSAKSCFLSLIATLFLSLTAVATELRGVILKVDAEKNQLTVEGRGLGVRGLTLTFALDKDVQILAGRKPAKLADLTPGRRVRVTYELQGERRVALLITLLGAPPTPAPPPVSPAGGGANLSGILRRISFTEREIVVVSTDAKGSVEVETTVSVPEDVKIAKDQKAVAFEDLKEGEPVVVQTDQRDGKLVARAILLGATSTVNKPPEPGPNNVQRLRTALKLIDVFLQMMESKR